MCVYVKAMVYVCGGQRTILLSWFSLCTFVWVSGIKLKLAGFSGNHFYPVSHLISPRMLIFGQLSCIA